MDVPFGSHNWPRAREEAEDEMRQEFEQGTDFEEDAEPLVLRDEDLPHGKHFVVPDPPEYEPPEPESLEDLGLVHPEWDAMTPDRALQILEREMDPQARRLAFANLQVFLNMDDEQLARTIGLRLLGIVERNPPPPF
jgi:hypothetical protein